MNLTELAQQTAERFRQAERAERTVYEPPLDRDTCLVQFALESLFTDVALAEQVDRARWTQAVAG